MFEYFNKNRYKTSVYTIFFILGLLEIIFLTRYFIFLYTLLPSNAHTSGVFSFFIYILLPPSSFILLTGLKPFKEVITRRYTALKVLTVITSVNTTVNVSYILYGWFFNLIVKLPFSPQLTLFLVYLFITLLPFLLINSMFKEFLSKLIGDKSLEKDILEFDFCYFLTDTFRDMKLPHIKVGIDSITGKNVYLYFKDRLTHVLCLGPTGGGKSSMTVIPQVYQDLKNKAYAVTCIKKKEFYQEKIHNIQEHTATSSFFAKLISSPVILFYKCKAKYYESRGTKCNLGVTCIEPKGDLIDTIVDIIDKHFPILKEYVVIIDPLKSDSATINVMNGIPYTAAEIVGSSLTEMQGGAKDFFALYQANVCRQIVLLLKYVHGDDCSMEDLSRVLSDSEQLKEEIKALDRINAASASNDYAGVIRYFKANTTNQKMADKFQELTLGLKAILEQLTLNPRMSRVMCGKSVVSFDRIINEGHILLINTAMGSFGELGHLFGRFCIMHYEYACFRRDIQNPDSLIPNYTYIDEFPLYRNKRFTEWLTLGRGYKTSAFIAAQGLSGLVVNGNSELRDMVLSCCRNKLIFGGISVEDAEIFSKEFGEEHYEEEMQGVKETGFMQGEPSYTKDVRKTWKTKPRFSVDDILYLDDKKIIAKIIKDRKILRPKLVSVDFLTIKSSSFRKKETIKVVESPEKDMLISHTLDMFEHQETPVFDEETERYIKDSLGESLMTNTSEAPIIQDGFKDISTEFKDDNEIVEIKDEDTLKEPHNIDYNPNSSSSNDTKLEDNTSSEPIFINEDDSIDVEPFVKEYNETKELKLSEEAELEYIDQSLKEEEKEEISTLESKSAEYLMEDVPITMENPNYNIPKKSTSKRKKEPYENQTSFISLDEYLGSDTQEGKKMDLSSLFGQPVTSLTSQTSSPQASFKDSNNETSLDK